MPACAEGVEEKPDYLAALSLVFLITISNISTLRALMLSMVLLFFDLQNWCLSVLCWSQFSCNRFGKISDGAGDIQLHEELIAARKDAELTF